MISVYVPLYGNCASSGADAVPHWQAADVPLESMVQALAGAAAWPGWVGVIVNTGGGFESMAMPPATPTVDLPKIDPTKSDVTLTWPANAEPDLVPAAAYGIQRDGQPIATVKQPGAGSAVSYTDTAVAPGSHTYQVIAFRCGVKSDCSDVVPSRPAPSDTVTANVAAAATPSNGPTTTVAGGTGGTRGAGTTATTTGATSSSAGASSGAVRDTVDLSGFADLLAKARGASHSTVTTEPDSGFQRTLPFHQRSNLPGSDGSPLGNAGPIGHLFDLRTVAVGMFLIVLAMHGFVLRAAARRTATSDGMAEPVEAR